jgi:nifR3 family TIM-barrel protein
MVRYGAGLVCSEMISDKALCFDSKKTFEMLDIKEDEHPCALQIFGADEEYLVKAVKILNEVGNHDVLDINMGCPVNKVIKARAGSYWLKEPEEAYKKVKAIVETSNRPVTVKVRIGYDKDNINVVEVAKLMEKAGVKMICVHGRTRSDFYSGKVDLEWIKKVKESINIPVVANGDIVDIDSAIHTFEYTKCDAISIGRGSLGNPWIFEQINHYLNTGERLEEPGFKERVEVCLQHARDLIKLKGERTGMMEMRSLACFYIKGMPNASVIKTKINLVESYQELENLLYNYLLELEENVQ